MEQFTIFITIMLCGALFVFFGFPIIGYCVEWWKKLEESTREPKKESHER